MCLHWLVSLGWAPITPNRPGEREEGLPAVQETQERGQAGPGLPLSLHGFWVFEFVDPAAKGFHFAFVLLTLFDELTLKGLDSQAMFLL